MNFTSIVIEDERIDETIERYFNIKKAEEAGGRAEEGLRLLRSYLLRAAMDKFYPTTLALFNFCEIEDCTVKYFQKNLNTLIKVAWRDYEELKALCVYSDYYMTRFWNHKPKLDEALAIMLTTLLSDTLLMVPEISEETFVRDWLRLKVEPLQVWSMKDFYCYAFLLDILTDTLYGFNTKYTVYIRDYSGKRVTQNALKSFFLKCWWYDPTLEESAIETLDFLKYELMLDYKRKKQSLDY